MRFSLLLVPTAMIAAQAGAAPTMEHHATGSFDVKITPEAQEAGPSGGAPIGRMALFKTFSGDVTGTARGAMLSAGVPQPGSAAAYVAIDQFSGRVDGRAGGFTLVHRGTMTKAGGGDLEVIIAPDSGTGALDGIAGTLTIRVEGGRHLYDLAYTLPEK